MKKIHSALHRFCDGFLHKILYVDEENENVLLTMFGA